MAPRYGLPSRISPPPMPVPSVSMTMYRVPRPAPWAHSASVAAFASLSIPTGRSKRSRIQARRSRSASGMFTEVTAFPLRWSIVDGMPNPIAATSSSSTSSTAPARPWRSSSCDSSGVGTSRRRSTVPSRSTMPARIFVPPRSTPITRWGRRIGVALVALLVLFIVWSVAGYLSFSGGVSKANKRVRPATKAALDSQNGLLLSHSTDILLLGTDHSNTNARASDQHSDSIMLLRTDPSHHRIVYLGSFKQLIDDVGGVTIDVPENILSNRFDCPYASQARCGRWPGWRFQKGKQHMNGQRALVYSRIRENRLNPSESDVTRAERQQRVVQATLHKLSSFSTFLSAPFKAGKYVRPVSTDLSAWQLVQLGWVYKRASASRAYHCRLGWPVFSFFGSVEEGAAPSLDVSFAPSSRLRPPRP